MKQARSLLRRLGAAGVFGVGILLACMSFYVTTLRPAEMEVVARREAVERLHARGPFRPMPADRRADELRRFYELFPPVERLTDELEAVYGFAREAKVDLMQGEYRFEKRGAGLTAYRITLPLRGTYAQTRAFVSAVLEKMPTSSVDALRFERKRIGDPQVEAQVRLTLYFQPAPDSR